MVDIQLDQNIPEGVLTYRIKATHPGGIVVYSKPIEVLSLHQEDFVSVFPNPVQDHLMNLQFNKVLPGEYKLELTGTEGRSLFSREIMVTGNNSHLQILLPRRIPAGHHILSLSRAGGPRQSLPITIR
jgi:hypothetical protein